tara:strand:- start:1026 stop:2189 length:1164 start_codon:yes stop_codon:yes gene_type:complete
MFLINSMIRKSLIVNLFLTVFAFEVYADSSSMSATSSGMGVLKNDYLNVGVNGTRGTFGSDESNSPGLQFDSSGSGTFNASEDYLTLNLAWDGFSIKVDGSNYTNNNAVSWGNDISGDGNGLTDGEGTLSWSGEVSNVFEITNTFGLSTNAPHVSVSSVITMSVAATNVYFSHFVDPDINGISNTNNSLGFGVIPESNIVVSEAQDASNVLGIYSPDSNVDAGITAAKVDADSYKTNVAGNGNNQIGLSWYWTNVSAGDTLTANHIYFFGPSSTLECLRIGSCTNLMSVNIVPEPDDDSMQYRPVAQTVNPDLFQTNIPICESNVWLSGMSVVGNGKVTHYIDYKHKDECFKYEVEVLPEDVDSRSEAQVFKHLGSSEFDVYKYRPS